MGKTLTNIILIGAAIAINVIPGVGQAISGAIVGLGGGTFAALGVANTVVSVLTAGLTLAGIQAASALIAGTPNMPKPDTTATSIKTARPPRVSAYGTSRLYGAYILYETSGEGRAVDVYAVHEGQMSGFVQAYLNDDKVTVGSSGAGPLNGGNVAPGVDDRYKDNFLQMYWTNGQTPGSPILNVVAQLPSIWTSNHRGDGVVTMALVCSPVKPDDFLDVYPNGVPTPSVVCQWQKCPDPYAADPTDESAWTFTENAIRHLLHYKMVREGVDYATKIAPTISYWRTASSICDEAIPLKAGGTEPRWRSCLAHKYTDSNATVTGALLATCDGWIAPRQDGALVVYAGKYYTPTVSIGSDQIISFEWNGVGVDDDKAVNEIICSYVSAAHDYNTVECDAWRDEDDIAARGAILSDNLDPSVSSWGQVRRLAKRRMARTNALYNGTVTTNVSGRIVRGQRYINLTLAEAGVTFYNGPVEITAVTRNINTGGVTFAWVAANPAIDSWNPATEEGEPAAVGDRIAPEPLETPTIISATPVTYDYGAQITVSAGGPSRDDLTWYTRWKVSTDTVWSEQPTTDSDPGTPVSLITPIVPAGVTIDVQVSYGIGDGRISAWSATTSVDTDASEIIYDGGDAETEA